MCLKTKTKSSLDLPGNFWREREIERESNRKKARLTCTKSIKRFQASRDVKLKRLKLASTTLQ